MKKAAEYIIHVARTSSTLDKKRLLKKYEDVPLVKEILKFTYDPYNKTGLGPERYAYIEKKARDLVEKQKTDFTPLLSVTTEQAIQYFSENTTGASTALGYAIRYAAYTLATYGEDAFVVAMCMLTQSLKIGASVSTLNSVYGSGFIPIISCMLAYKIGDRSRNSLVFPMIATEKIDGARRMLIKQNGKCALYSRSGHPDTGLVEIMKAAKYLPDNFMYDGELTAIGTFKDSIALRQATTSIANSKGERVGACFNVFDMVPINEFHSGKSIHTARDRKLRLSATFGDESGLLLDEEWHLLNMVFGVERLKDFSKVIKPVPILGVAKNYQDIEELVEPIWRAKGEGIMLNVAKAPYTIKRTPNLLKVKKTEEYTLPIVGFIEGTGKFVDTLGAVLVSYKGNKVGVGSGFTEEERRIIWDNRDDYLDREIEIDSFGESKNANGGVSLNCPIFKRFKGVVE